MTFRLIRQFAALLLLTGAVIVWSETATAYTANKVWFLFKPYGGYRVYINYTVPELKEFREAYVEFKVKKEAEKYYWDLLRGADFFLPATESIRFTKTAMEPQPW